MCGIIGYHSIQASSEFDIAFQSGMKSLLHRGPDGSGYLRFDGDKGALGHTRLSILDLSDASAQPMTIDEASIAFNGELYNFRELRENLVEQGVEFQSSGDTEVLLKQYLHDKRCGLTLAQTCKKFNGIFAFAIWDEKDKRLSVVRDELGVKPLYYSNQEGFWFASEAKALPTKVNAMDPRAIDSHLNFIWNPGSSTLNESIYRLAPGHMIEVEEGQITQIANWSKAPSAIQGTTKRAKTQAIIDGTEGLLRQAVHRQLVSDVPVGAFLSGGLDSSAIVNFAKEVNPDIQCFTIDAGGIEAGFQDDLIFARRVAALYGVPLNEVRVDSAALIDNFEDFIYQLDEPIADPAAMNLYFMSKAAKEMGIKVALSGAGGDDLFSGYRRHQAVAIQKFWRWMPRPILRSIEVAAERLPVNTPLLRRARKLFEGVSLNEEALLLNYFRWSKPETIKGLYSQKFNSLLASDSRTPEMEEYLSGLDCNLSNLQKMLLLEQRFFLADHNLCYTDKMSMWAGVEVRVPFLDSVLVRYANDRIPDGLKQRGLQSKWILKKLMEPYLPRDIIYRKKVGFGVPLRSWINGPMSNFVADTLNRDVIKMRGIFDELAVRKLVEDTKAGKVDGSYTILSLVALELWFRRFGPDLKI